MVLSERGGAPIPVQLCGGLQSPKKTVTPVGITQHYVSLVAPQARQYLRHLIGCKV
jgi:hypothetical protein